MKKKSIQRINIPEIKDPTFLKNLNNDELKALSSDMCDYLVDLISKNGGHLSSNLGTIDATIALCRCFDFTKDKIIFDVGHQCYTYKVLTGRNLQTLRQKNGFSGFQKRDESIYDHFEAGHSSTSISAANGMAIARDLNKEKYDIIAFIGDSSIVNGLALEGLNNAAQNGHKIIIVLNDNDMSISKPVGGMAKAFRKFSTSDFYRKSKHFFRKIMVKTRFGRWQYRKFTGMKNWFKRHLLKINIFDTLGYSVIGPVDGHSIKTLEKAFERAKKTDKSVVVHIQTIKGKGYSHSENDKSGVWHGVSGFNKETGEIEKNTNGMSWSEVYKDGILNRMASDENAVTIVPATELGSGLTQLFEEYPNRTLDVGIAEEHAMTMASGLAVSGKHPIISIYSTFLQRAYDEISHDLARMNLDTTIFIDRAGLVGNDGETHQGIYDESILMSIPNVVVAMASNYEQSKALVEESKNSHGVFCIRYPKENIESNENTISIPFGTWLKEAEGQGTAIVSVGPETENLKKIIKKRKLNVTLYNAIYQKPMDDSAVKELLNYNKVIIYNAYATESGFANALCAKLIQLGYKGQTIVKAVPDTFVKHASINEQKEEFDLLAENIIELI